MPNEDKKKPEVSGLFEWPFGVLPIMVIRRCPDFTLGDPLPEQGFTCDCPNCNPMHVLRLSIPLRCEISLPTNVSWLN